LDPKNRELIIGLVRFEFFWLSPMSSGVQDVKTKEEVEEIII